MPIPFRVLAAAEFTLAVAACSVSDERLGPPGADGGPFDASRADVRTDGPVDTAPLPWTVLFTDPGSPNDLEVDETHVYWMNQGDGLLRRGLKTGGSAETLAQGSRILAHYIALSDTEVFFNQTNERIARVSKSGGPVRVVVADQPSPTAFKVSLGELFWATGNERGKFSGTVASLPIDGSSGPRVLSQGHAGLGTLAVDADYVYFTRYGELGPTEGAVLRVPRAGGDTVALVTGVDSPYALWIDDERVYWAEGFHVSVTKNVFNGRIRSLRKDAPLGTTPDTLADNHASGYALIGDDKSLYWITEYPTSVWGVSKTGGDVQPLAWNQQLPVALAIDNGYVYWTNFALHDGAIARAARRR